LLNQFLSFKFCPEFRRNSGLHRGIVRENLLFAARADDQRCRHIRRRRELKCCGAKVYTVIGCDFAQLFAFLQKFRGYLVGFFSVVVTRTAGDESGVQGRTNHQRGVLSSDRGEKLVERILMIDQGILRCH